MKTLALDAEITRFIQRYLEISGLSTVTSVAQQRIDYENEKYGYRQFMISCCYA